MSDKVILDNYLMLLKSTVEVYVHGTIESSNENIRMLLKGSLDDTLTSQADTYNLMVKNNWCVVNNVKASDIKKIYDKVNSN